MFRKDAIANMTLGETLQRAIIKGLTHTFTPATFVNSAIAANQMLQDQLFDGNTNDASSALTLADKFETAAVLNYADQPMAQQLFMNLAKLCTEYYETVYHLHNEEADYLPF